MDNKFADEITIYTKIKELLLNGLLNIYFTIIKYIIVKNKSQGSKFFCSLVTKLYTFVAC